MRRGESSLSLIVSRKIIHALSRTPSAKKRRAGCLINFHYIWNGAFRAAGVYIRTAQLYIHTHWVLEFSDVLLSLVLFFFFSSASKKKKWSEGVYIYLDVWGNGFLFRPFDGDLRYARAAKVHLQVSARAAVLFRRLYGVLLFYCLWEERRWKIKYCCCCCCLIRSWLVYSLI